MPSKRKKEETSHLWKQIQSELSVQIDFVYKGVELTNETIECKLSMQA